MPSFSWHPVKICILAKGLFLVSFLPASCRRVHLQQLLAPSQPPLWWGVRCRISLRDQKRPHLSKRTAFMGLASSPLASSGIHLWALRVCLIPNFVEANYCKLLLQSYLGGKVGYKCAKYTKLIRHDHYRILAFLNFITSGLFEKPSSSF